jgi:hypothetical protein
MWERLTPTDIHQARDRLTLSRADMLRKHAEELKGLDDEHDEIEMLERLIGSFTQKYVNSKAARGNLAHHAEAQPAAPVPNPIEATVGEVQQSGLPVHLPVRPYVSPNGETPPRLRRFIGG